MIIQFKKGVLELCTLSMLQTGDRYGYDIASNLSKLIDVSDGAVYPVLRRLRDEGYVTSYLEESSGGPARKYYVITDNGNQYLSHLKSEWFQLTTRVNGLISHQNAEGNLK